MLIHGVDQVPGQLGWTVAPKPSRRTVPQCTGERWVATAPGGGCPGHGYHLSLGEAPRALPRARFGEDRLTMGGGGEQAALQHSHLGQVTFPPGRSWWEPQTGSDALLLGHACAA